MTQLYTLEAVSLNNGLNNNPTWIVIRDIVYDASNYLDDHPGGGELIIEWAGRDATKAFDDFGHSNDAKKLLHPMKIGELVEEDRKANRKKVAKPVAVAKTNQDPTEKKGWSWMCC